MELQWLVSIGPENVANICHLSFAHHDDGPITTTQMDLLCLDASECVQIQKKICKCSEACEDRLRRSLIEKLNNALSDMEYKDGDEDQFIENVIRWHGQDRANKLRKTIADLRISFGRFGELCGTGKKVKSSVEDIKLLTLAAFSSYRLSVFEKIFGTI